MVRTFVALAGVQTMDSLLVTELRPEAARYSDLLTQLSFPLWKI